MKEEDKKELWRWAVHNKSFEICERLTELRSTFLALVGEDNIVIHDRYSLIERQIRVCELELSNLKSLLSREHDYSKLLKK